MVAKKAVKKEPKADAPAKEKHVKEPAAEHPKPKKEAKAPSVHQIQPEINIGLFGHVGDLGVKEALFGKNFDRRVDNFLIFLAGELLV